jgi:dihydroxyacid dehydratase/phosphogluconate dehydratase
LRSDAWLGGDDEVALNHRAALREAGLRRSRGSPGRSRGPLIGIASTASDLNRCDLGLRSLAAAVRRGVQAAGGHAAPESAVGGPLARLRDGDLVSLDAYAGSLSVSADLDGREPVLPPVRDRRGWPVLHRMHVTQAPEGCDYDFLQAGTPDEIAFAEPVIGRS